MNNGTFSVSWILPNTPARRKQLLLDLDDAIRRLRVIEKQRLSLGKQKAKAAVVACAEKLLREYSAELAEARAAEAIKVHQAELKRPFFLEA